MIAIKTDTDLIAAVPALLRCVPTDAVTVVFFTADSAVAATARFDYEGFVEGLTQWCSGDAAAHPVTEVAAYAAAIISPATPPTTADIRSYSSALLDQMPALGITVNRILITTGFTEGRWVDVLSGDRGEVVDYRTTNIVASTVADGAVIASSDIEIEVEASRLGDVYDGDPAAILSQADVLAAVREHVKAHSAPPAPALLTASFTSYVEKGRFRDSVFSVLVDDPAPSADLFITLARHARGRSRAHLLAYSAMASYFGGDSIRSRVVLNLCVQTAAGDLPTLGALARQCLTNGVPPAEIIAQLRAYGL
ncbi:DUF4192 family protein [Gordonia sihwensis]|uniref:DUF4192 family protein n=1 Tax=Gordonia sihwensis TaxID=173559 RepID=UPI0018CEAF52|nr:DUF4192 family protein [Gordonia sihwensis]